MGYVVLGTHVDQTRFSTKMIYVLTHIVDELADE